VQVGGQPLSRELPHLRPTRKARHRRVGITPIHPAGTGAGTGGRVWASEAAGVGAGGVLADGAHLGPGRERPDPADRRDDPDQVIIGQGRQDLLIGGGGVHESGQDRARVHLVRGAVLAESDPGDVPGRQFLPRGRGGHQFAEVGRAILLILGPRGLEGAVVPARRSRPRTVRLGGVRVGGGERG